MADQSKKRNTLSGKGAKFTSILGSEKVATLRKNFLPILISPRVHEIPIRYKLTLFIYLFILILSAGIVLMIDHLTTGLDCEAAPLPFEPPKALESCLQDMNIRKDFTRQADVDFDSDVGKIEVSELVEITVLLQVLTPEIFDDDQMTLSEAKFGPFFNDLIDTAKSFNLDEELERSEVLLILLDLFSRHSDGSLNSFVKEVEIVNETIFDADDFFDEETGYYFYDVVFEPEIRESLKVNYRVGEELVSCTLLFVFDLDKDFFEGILTVDCSQEKSDEQKEAEAANLEADEQVEDSDIFRLFYEPQQSKNVFIDLIVFFANIHAPLDLEQGVEDLDELFDEYDEEEEDEVEVDDEDEDAEEGRLATQSSLSKWIEQLGWPRQLQEEEKPEDDSGGRDDDADFNQDSIIVEMLATSSVFCCTPETVSYYDMFGLVIGFGFALEGLVTFFFAVTLFRGRLGLQPAARKTEFKRNSDSKHQDHTEVEKGELEAEVEVEARAESEEQVKMSTAAAGAKNLSADGMEDQEDDEEDELDSGLKKRMYQQGAIKSVSLQDLQRAVFNPRCKTIPYANIVSLASVIFVIIISIIAANYARILSTTLINVAIEFTEASADDLTCSPSTIRLFKFLDTSSISDNGFGSFGFDLTLSVSDYSLGLDVITFEEDQRNAIAEACQDFTLLEPGTSCLENVDESSFIKFERNFSSNELLSPGVELFESVYRGTFDSSINFFIRIQEIISENNSEIELEFDAANENIQYKVLTAVQGVEVLTNDFDSTIHQAMFTRVFLEEIAGSHSNLNAELANTFVRCTKEDSLDYFEHLGIMLGYITLFEGLLTFFIAYVIYRFFGIFQCSKQ